MKIEKWNEINGADSHESRLEAFIEAVNDSYAIMQLKQTEETRPERFASRAELANMGIEPCFDHYEIVYVAPLETTETQSILLERLYEKFNIAQPDSFRGHSLSVSDIVALKQNDVISCHYVDTIGFWTVPDFWKPENYLKNAEMTIEDDYDMIDGIINNGKMQAIDVRTSVLEKLRGPSNMKENSKNLLDHLERELE